MADRDDILAQFQSFTGLDDFGECIAILEQHDWNLQEAVQNAYSGIDSPQHVPLAEQILPSDDVSFDPFMVSGQGFLRGSENIDVTGGFVGFDSFESFAIHGGADSGASHVPIRMLHFKVEYRDQNHAILLQDSENVGKIKEMIEVETGIPVEKQELHGWLHKNDALIQDTDILRDLTLPKENTLFLLTPDLPLQREEHSPEKLAALELASRLFLLVIRHVDKERNYEIKYPGSKTIKEVKLDVFTITNVQVRHQVWKGWPESCTDETTLAASGINHERHELEVSGCDKNNHTTPQNELHPHPTTATVSDEMEVESDDDMPPDDDDMIEETFTASHKPLIPKNISNETEGTENFCREFQTRYGDSHPVFYIGTLEDSIRDALQCKARDRKMLAVYLHHDHSIQANVFCSQVLCTETTVSFLSANFITWAWDLTHECNRQKFRDLCAKNFGTAAANTVGQFKPDQLPLLLVISRNRGSNEVVQVVQGNAGIDELMLKLIHAVDVFKNQQIFDIQEEEERDARERVLAEQNAAYQDSLQKDKAKAEARKQEENEKKKQEELEKIRKCKEEQKKEEKEAKRLSLANQLPEEPAANCTQPCIVVRLKCPGGQMVTRRFLDTTPLRVLFNYVTAQGYHIEDYKLLTTFPKRDLTQLDATQTLKDAKLCPQETLILEEL